jgi:hypothetical protein
MIPQVMFVHVQQIVCTHLICLALGASVAAYFAAQALRWRRAASELARQIDDARSDLDMREIEIRRILTDRLYYLHRVSSVPATDPMTRGFDLPTDPVCSLTVR